MQCEPHKRCQVCHARSALFQVSARCARRGSSRPKHSWTFYIISLRAPFARAPIFLRGRRPAPLRLVSGLGVRGQGLVHSSCAGGAACRIAQCTRAVCAAVGSGTHGRADRTCKQPSRAAPRRAVSCVGAARVPSAHYPNYRVHWFVCLPLLSFVGNEGTAKLHSDRTLKQPYWFNKQVGDGALGCRPQRAGVPGPVGGWPQPAPLTGRSHLFKRPCPPDPTAHAFRARQQCSGA